MNDSIEVNTVPEAQIEVQTVVPQEVEVVEQPVVVQPEPQPVPQPAPQQVQQSVQQPVIRQDVYIAPVQQAKPVEQTKQNTESKPSDIYTVDLERIVTDIKNPVVVASQPDTVAEMQIGKADLTAQLRYESPLAQETSWILPLALTSVFLIGFIRVRSFAFVVNLLSSTFSDNNLKNLFNTLPTQNYWPYRLMNIVYYLVVSLFAYEALVAYDITSLFGYTSFMQYGVLLIGISVFHLAKYLINKIIGFAFSSDESYNDIIQCKTIACNLVCLSVLPLSLIFPFISKSGYNMLIIIALVFVSYFYLWRVVKTFKIILRNNVSAFYTILYLCTVEVLPVVCLYKYLRMLIA
ncbi:MAG: DUF4271 domain-containing protein [Bacteroidales bacterium]|nr:DUF4271 domain-containing protein [Bacteroidales bacterium]